MSKNQPEVWRYVLPNIRHEGWAISLMDSTGYFSVVSDFGNYVFKWNAFEGDFRAFLIQVEDDYLLSKISQRTLFDDEETVRSIKTEIIGLRRTGSLSAEQARTEWDLASSIEDEVSFGVWHGQTHLSDAAEHHVKVYPGDARGFVKRVWPRLCALWRAELESKGTT